MRRKSERTATKKTKPSPEKKVEKTKRGRTRRNRKQSSSSENESAGETSPVRAVEVVAEPEKTPPPSAPVKEDSPEETPDQVWQVKTTEGPSDGGEIKKLKICLTRPPSTPERADRSPRSKRKHSRATSSSDTPSVEAVEDKRKKHRSKRATRESKDESDKTQDSQGDESETQTTKSDNAISQSTDAQKSSDETPMSTTNEETKTDSEPKSESTGTKDDSKTTESDVQTESQKPSDADTTVASPKADTAESQDSQSDINTSSEKGGSTRKRSVSIEKSEVLEIHADESKSESLELSKADEDSKEGPDKEKESTGDKDEVSIIADKKDNTASEEAEATRNESKTRKATNENHVLESSEHVNKPRIRMRSTDSDKDKYVDSTDRYRSRDLERSDSTQSTQEEIHNGEAAPIVVSRKRRWGSRHSKITTHKSITISTDVLKEIIPDVKPAEFDEVIEEKKHKRIEVTEKLTRPVLPKIIIDNTESVEMHRKDQEDKDKENVKVRDSLGTNRKISIVNDNDNILGRPPSPPRHKQSNILYITNLVRPFTLPQLKNLLQRTGRIVENGFWIDRIKSKCFVKYESEDQAVETRHALHGVTWPVSNPKALQVDFSAQEAFDHAKLNEDTDNAQASTIPGTVEDWLREQDLKRERGELEKPWERKAAMREWDVGKNEKEKEKDRLHRDERPMDKRRHRTPERSPEPAKKFKKKEEEAPAKLLDDLFRKTKTTPCIYWLPLSAETIAVKEEQRRQHMAEHERRLQELRRTHPHPHPHPHPHRRH